MPKIRRLVLERVDGSEIDISYLLNDAPKILDIDCVGVEGLLPFLEKEGNNVSEVSYQYEAIERLYQNKISLETLKENPSLPLNKYVEEILDEKVIEQSLQKLDIFQASRPFKHLVIDGLWQPEVLAKVVEKFPEPSKMGGEHFNDERQNKFGTGVDVHSRVSPYISDFLLALVGKNFRKWLSQITGLDNLVGDPLFKGSGLHQATQGGKLDIHVDFNRLTGHPNLKSVDRRLNVLIFLNKDWSDHFNGHLEFWKKGAIRPARKIRPDFNRTVLFEATSKSFHGHPIPLSVPDSTTRKSIASYYYQGREGVLDFEGCELRTTEWLF